MNEEERKRKAQELLKRASSLADDLDFNKILSKKSEEIKYPSASLSSQGNSHKSQKSGSKESLFDTEKPKKKNLSFGELMNQAKSIDVKDLGLFHASSNESLDKTNKRKEDDNKNVIRRDIERTAPQMQRSVSPPKGAINPNLFARKPTKSVSDVSYMSKNPAKKQVSMSASRDSLKPKDKKKLPVNANLVALNTVKRDRTTIEDLQDELSSKRNQEKERIERNRQRIREEEERKRREKLIEARKQMETSRGGLPKEKEQLNSTGAQEKKRPRPVSPRSHPSAGAPSASKRRAQSPVKKYKNVDEALLDQDYVEKNYSSLIQSMFGYNRRKYNDYSDDSDMEAGFDDIRKEEARSTRIAKKEDELAEQMERELEKRKRNK